MCFLSDYMRIFAIVEVDGLVWCCEIHTEMSSEFE